MSNAASNSSLLALRVAAVASEATAVKSFDLVAADGSQLPPFAAGAHIDLHLPNGLVRSYSLIGSPTERFRYRIAVLDDTASRGGSRFMHEHVSTGTVLQSGSPRNNFELNESAANSTFIAGGIGITPFLSMIGRLDELGRSWRLHYCARSRLSAAFLDFFAQRRGQVSAHFDDEVGQLLDLPEIVRGTPREWDLYCCGPNPMLDVFEKATRDRSSQKVHVEYFKANKATSEHGGFVVVLARSNRRIHIERGETILNALLNAGLNLDYSCKEGICAACETRVLAGVPDHRDLVLNKAERASNERMMICCSGSKTAELVLDL